MSSFRPSLGGPLGDGTNRRVARRASLSGGAIRVATPRKHARTTGDHARNMASGDDYGTENHLNKRPRQNHPPLPPSARYGAVSNSEASLAALERFNQRMLQKQQQQFNSNEMTQNSDVSFEQNSFVLGLDQSERGGGSFLSASSPSTYRTKDRRQTMMYPPRGSMSFLSQESESSAQLGLSQTSIESDPFPFTKTSDAETVEEVGFRSSMKEMEQRIIKLEREKTEIIKSKAPLEARFRQKEQEWIKEERRMVEEIESLKRDCRAADDRYHDLKVQFEAKEEECKELRKSLYKASSVVNGNRNLASNTGWSRHLQHEREIKELSDKLKAAEDEIESIRLEKNSIEKEVHGTGIELQALQRRYDQLEETYNALYGATSENKEYEITLRELEVQYEATAAQLNATNVELARVKAQGEAKMKESKEEHEKRTNDLLFEIDVLKAEVASRVNVYDKTDKDELLANLSAQVSARDRRISELEEALAKGEEQRRQMHNRIQELRGNIRVFVRTRPFLPNDGANDESAVDVNPDGENLSIVDVRTNNSHAFKFDKVFPQSAGQDIVFEEVSDFVQSALDGYHVCLFSYGQTGSGKTHTMQGSGVGAMRGIIPRAVEQILAQSKLMQTQNWSFQLSASFLEIYNEELKDLLLSCNSTYGQTDPKKLTIKRSREGKSFVDGLTEVSINTVDQEKGMSQLQSLMSVAARSRSVASTKMNAQSSRSHSVFMLYLNGYNEESGAQVKGVLNLCDLAGSERLDRSGAGSDAKRLRETQAINKSLSCLGDVFNSLATKASHIPYRNSKLTYLLQDCLSGDGKALMFVNLSPTTASSNESLCSLRFAQRVNQVELGKAIKHVEYTRN